MKVRALMCILALAVAAGCNTKDDRVAEAAGVMAAGACCALRGPYFPFASTTRSNVATFWRKRSGLSLV